MVFCNQTPVNIFGRRTMTVPGTKNLYYSREVIQLKSPSHLSSQYSLIITVIRYDPNTLIQKIIPGIRKKKYIPISPLEIYL